MSKETKQKFIGGVSTSEGATMYQYLDVIALKALAEHVHNGTDGSGGAVRHGKDDWKKGLKNLEFLEDRLNHLIDHAIELQQHLTQSMTSHSTIAIDKMIRGIGANWMFLQVAIEKAKEETQQEVKFKEIPLEDLKVEPIPIDLPSYFRSVCGYGNHPMSGNPVVFLSCGHWRELQKDSEVPCLKEKISCNLCE